MQFTRSIKKTYDLFDKYVKDTNSRNYGSVTLASVCQDILGKKLCLGEEISNWEQRPLRYSQEHYAYMNVFIMLEILFF